ncbi:DinB family protein [Bacillaceae bacterium SIJ1]|uniref:DinB family protein n=1 Tax=Litoribacterium kuwaitense TaxID=1398745 RepID=UPI0013EDD0F0|nr:DinB family protein [Litoribacterium kuwaitense]NGP44926.1 DinB family protein [Litoribacterium kuwaitense]
MNEETNIINEFRKYSSWLNTLEDMDETLWAKPVAKDRWSVSEIIAHIIYWDNHLLSEVLLSVRHDKGMTFPDFDTQNQKAADYAKSGISQAKLLEEARNTREHFIRELNELPTDMLNASSSRSNYTFSRGKQFAVDSIWFLLHFLL